MVFVPLEVVICLDCWFVFFVGGALVVDVGCAVYGYVDVLWVDLVGGRLLFQVDFFCTKKLICCGMGGSNGVVKVRRRSMSSCVVNIWG
jgi:hypothetical protein